MKDANASTKHVMFSSDEAVIINDILQEVEGDTDSYSSEPRVHEEEEWLTSSEEHIYDTVCEDSSHASSRPTNSPSDFIGTHPSPFDWNSRIFPASLPELQRPSMKSCLKYSTNITSLADSENEDLESVEECLPPEPERDHNSNRKFTINSVTLNAIIVEV